MNNVKSRFAIKTNGLNRIKYRNSENEFFFYIKDLYIYYL